MKLHRFLGVLLVVPGLLWVSQSGTAVAQEFRTIRAIPTPPPPSAPREEGRRFRPVPRQTIERAVDRLLKAWNTPELRGLLSQEYYEQTRLPDALSAQVPRDAIIRVLSIASWTTLEQKEEPADPAGDTLLVTSTVSVVVNSQLEYNDAVEGFTAVPGSNKYVFDVVDMVPQ